ncbi:MAG: response regulator [Candidatus Omnitrophica bacterium]|nr:response regulator [Candidatus Omnitrophota bacterium]
MRVLVADDEEDVLRFTKNFLEKKGFTVDTASNGKEAIELLELKDYGVVFLDENMPELTGLEVVEYMKKNGFNSKIVLVTGYTSIKEDLAKLVGVDEYLQKPIDLEKILSLANKYNLSFEKEKA